ncbi:MAG: hypothetical protein NTX87_17315 [Planctomycetota bacterium]|nr:hypothetical protein [Planctomycetota bacterium]
MMRIALGVTLALLAAGCGRPQAAPQATGMTFKDDVTFLDKHGGALVLSDASGLAQVAVMPAFQGRVMTSTADGPEGMSFGWINRDLLASGKTLEHFNPYGGEERLWLGPEGGQFSIYFAKGAPFDLAHWYVPPAIDTEPFDILSKGPSSALFHRRFQVTNYSGTTFDVDIRRQVRVLAPVEAWKLLGAAPAPRVRMVAYESVNTLTNAGKEPWRKDTGLLSVWILGMFNPSPATTVVIPIKAGPDAELGPPVKDDYFGKVPADRLVVKDGVVYFSADGQCRSKIGVSPKRVKPIAGSYDAASRVLTLVQFTLPAGAADYVNSAWEIQEKPYAGDVANSYNDGPSALKTTGQFYEIESSSPAAALGPGQSLEHIHRTIHLRGEEKDLDAIARKMLGVGLQEITTALPKK